MVVTGRLVAAAAVGAVLVTFAVPSWLGVALTSLTIFTLMMIDLALMGRADDLLLERTPLSVVRLGRSIDSELVVTNIGDRHIRGLLWDDWPYSTRPAHREHRIDLAPGTRTRLRTTLTPTHRGDRAAGPITLRLLGPLGMAGRQTRQTVDTRVRALPPFRSERLLVSKAKQLQLLEGRNRSTLRGQGTEFDSFREYVPGDDVRAIDWRATARAADVLVRTWRPERNRHVLMLLDTGRISAARVGDGTRLDAAIEAALLLGGLAAAAGDTVGLLAYDRRVRCEVSAENGRGLQPKLMHALAGVTPALVDTDTGGLVREAVHRSRRRGLLVWFTGLDGVAAAENLVPVLPMPARRHRVLIVSVTDPEIAAAADDRTDLDAIYRAAAAETRLAEQALVQESLRRMGVSVVAATPERLPEVLADEYLELKRSGAV
ncbi:DUF58 domain-containing protein [Nocardia paucivorans]|uniref:DUF58 domain-containing protein n=1 Tax=Nocardia paucivorans TaxID=114259 RepID=UPI0003075FAC|nr:DUF58 domain-containing protein [Nocardia paucivorans]